ncbi:ABC transporter substrate-binding protein [Acidimicrobiales bacterium]|jgi:peptide/nickel transport system substrate-binding protein|nr:ABC transporter substrate-binding protein [Acidimicrobiaceae bacterium]MDB4818568.1 ABC transporter substrate-binding protein [Acidimicrobiales bacterium]MDC3300003.1 ABC transporter substrate-binding protein [Acidimicrobiales bacterium]
MIRQKLLMMFALVLSVSLFAAACGGSDSDTEEASDSDTTTTTEAEDEPEAEAEAEEPEAEEDTDDQQAVDTTLDEEELEELGSDDVEESAVASGDPVPGGTLVLGSTQVPRHLNGVVQSGYATAVPGTQLNASPLLFDDEFNPQPYLAESWEVAEDGLSVTLNLVEGAVFHDGVPITSADVAFSMLAARDNHPFKTMFAPVSDVETPDPQTAIVRLSQPHPAILLAMSPGLLPIIPKHIFDDGQDLKTHPRNTEDFVGSGPFRLTEYEAGSIIRMEKFEDFFIPERPYLDEIIIEITPDPNSIVLGLENGTTHVSASLGAAANILRLQDNEDVVVTAQGHEAIGQVTWLEFNVADPILSDVRVRQAIGYAIDRDFLADVIQQGTQFPLTTGIVAASPFHNPDTEHYDVDIEAAKALLAEAGYAEGEISLAVDYIPPGQQADAEYIVQALGDIGINAELNVSPDFPTWAGRVAAGEHQLTVNNVWNWGDPVIGVHRTYLSDNRVGAIWTNNTGYENAEVDALLDKAGKTFDRDERIALYGEFQDIVADEVPIYFLTNPPFWQAINPSVQNPSVGIWGLMSPMLDVWIDE